MALMATDSDDDPDDGARKENLDRELDACDAKHAPVKAQDRGFGEEEGRSVHQLGDVEEEFGLEKSLFLGKVLDVPDVQAKAILDP
jgi:hypothetical protein